MSDCLFCKIVGGQIGAKKLYEDDHVLAFADINPQAPVHALIVPKRHIARLDEATDEDRETLGRLLLAARDLARELGIAAGYRVVNNCGESAGQSVFHIHVHLLGGRPLAWPPG